jgi:hypothetical protein
MVLEATLPSYTVYYYQQIMNVAKKTYGLVVTVAQFNIRL